MQKIKELVENGFANKRIAGILSLKEKDVKNITLLNNWKLIKENFSEDKIDHICDLYTQGVSAKQLGYKYTIDKRRIQKWADQKGVLRDKSSAHRFTEFNQHIFDVIDTDEKAYWLGFFYADAYNCVITNTFSITLQDVDYEHLVKLSKFIGLPECKIKRYNSILNGKEYPTCSIRMYSKHICEKMIELGCPRAKSFIITFPEWLNKNLEKSFIRGIFDGDGCLTKRQSNNEWKWSLVSTEMMCKSIQQIILQQLNIIINYHNISKTGNNTCELEQSGNEKILIIMKWLYGNINDIEFLNRKYNKMQELQEQQNNRCFARETYKVSEESTLSIIKDIKAGSSILYTAKKHNVHPKTVSKIMKDKM